MTFKAEGGINGSPRLDPGGVVRKVLISIFKKRMQKIQW